jgi:DNA-binding transcriptional regulator LsrR (DeoR family)
MVVRLKRETGLTQVQIAERTGIPRGTVGRMLAAERAERDRIESGVDKVGILPSWAR